MERPRTAGERDRAPALFVAVGVGVALASIPLAAAAGEPYLGFDQLSPWIVTYAVGLFGALFAAPFAIHRALRGLLEADARWERALLIWGAVALGTLVLALLCGLPSGFASDSLPGALGLVTAVEATLVVGTLLVWLLSS